MIIIVYHNNLVYSDSTGGAEEEGVPKEVGVANDMGASLLTWGVAIFPPANVVVEKLIGVNETRPLSQPC